MGDQNGNGITNELDALDADYCSSAILEINEDYSFSMGELILDKKKINGTYFDENGQYISSCETKGFCIQFSIKYTNNQLLTGNMNLTDNRK